MTSKLKEILVIILISLIPTLLLWMPFFFRIEKVMGIPIPKDGMATVVANYDGPLYIVVAKTFYDSTMVNNFEFGLPSKYYAAHFPLYPGLIRFFSPVFGYVYSMLFVTLFTSILTIYFFYKFVECYLDKKSALWSAFVFGILPARFLIVRSVGSPEPLFLAGIIASLYYFRQKKYILAGLWGAVAQLTKSPAILLFISYVFAIAYPKLKEIAFYPNKKFTTAIGFKKLLYLLIMPLSLLSVFTLYQFKLSDFFAYFNSGDNIHLFFPPFQIFNYSQPWVGTFWLEEVIFVYLLILVGLSKLIRMKEYDLAWFVGIFFTSILFVSHRDIIRYSLPVTPSLFIAFSDTLIKREFKIIMAILIIPIYLFSLAFISQNVMHISDWAPLL